MKQGMERKWRFSSRECRGLLVLVPVVVILAWLVTEAVHPRFGDSTRLLGDAMVEENNCTSDTSVVCELSPFDPNTVTYEELRTLGFDRRTSAGIVKYRAAGKVFAIPEDFATCYGVTDSAYARLKPYIIIGEEYRLRPHVAEPAVGAAVRDTVECLWPFDPNALGEDGFVALGFTPRQARTIINFREACGGFDSAEEFSRCYAVSEEMFGRLKNYICIAERRSDSTAVGAITAITAVVEQGVSLPLELNGADSVSLDAVPGIGGITAAVIIRYRERLGGYCRKEQVLETGVVTERNWERMREQIYADSCAIQKIDINFAAPNAVAEHPYITPRMLRRILRNRQLKGGWSTIEDMTEDNTLTKEEAARLAPYLHFGTAPSGH